MSSTLPPHDDAASEKPHSAPTEGLGPNPTTREGAVQPRETNREVPMPERPIETTAVRGGATLGHMRWVLLGSLALVVIAMAVAFVLS